MLYENAHFGRHPAAGGPHDEDWHCSLKRSQKTDGGTFSQFCGEEPCWRLGNTDHGRGIYLMKTLMDEVRFEEGGVVVQMRKVVQAATKNLRK